MTTERHLELVDNDTGIEVVHIWCTKCETRNPMRSVCGKDLTGESKVDETTLPDCKVCDDLWESHQNVLHT